MVLRMEFSPYDRAGDGYVALRLWDAVGNGVESRFAYAKPFWP